MATKPINKINCGPKKLGACWAKIISVSFIFLLLWCRRRDSNSHALWALDFESNASTNSATPAILQGKIQKK